MIERQFQSLLFELAAHRRNDEFEEARTDSTLEVPVTLLTGFLGAGKSTLLKSLLVDPPDGLRVKALVNDVGALDFDPTLITSGDERSLDVELSNGCGCCAASGDLADALHDLVGSQPDMIVLEASGVADPFALKQLVVTCPGARLERVVAAVDAVALPRILEEPDQGPVLCRQIEAADTIVATRADLLSDTDVAGVVELLGELAPGRTVSVSSLSSPDDRPLRPGSLRGSALPEQSTTSPHCLTTRTATLSGTISQNDLALVLSALPPSIVRMKGSVSLTEGGRASVQVTPSGRQIEVLPPRAGTDGTASCQKGSVTVIGTDPVEVDNVFGKLGGGSG